MPTVDTATVAAAPDRRFRPYWHVDAKWVSGLLLLVVLAAALLVHVLVGLTEEERAVRLMATAMAAAFSPGGLDDDGDFVKVRQQMREQKLERFYPFPGQSVSISAADLDRLSPREARITLFRQIAEPLYRDGAAAAAARVVSDPAARAKAEQDMGLMSAVSRQSHQALQRLRGYLATAAGLLAALMAYFSAGYGRLGSLGCVLLFASLPGALLSAILNAAGARDPGPHPATGEGGNMVGLLASYLIPDIAPVFAAVFGQALIAALTLTGVSIISSLAHGLARRRRQRRSAGAT